MADVTKITTRVSEKMHQRAMLAAEVEGVSLQQWMMAAIEDRIGRVDDDAIRAHLEDRYRSLLAGDDGGGGRRLPPTLSTVRRSPGGRPHQDGTSADGAHPTARQPRLLSAGRPWSTQEGPAMLRGVNGADG